MWSNFAFRISSSLKKRELKDYTEEREFFKGARATRAARISFHAFLRVFGWILRLPDWLNGSIPGLFLFMCYLPDLSASGCKHFGRQQSFTSYRVTSNTVEVPEFHALEWRSHSPCSLLDSARRCRGPNCYQPILKYCLLFKIPSSLRGHGQISYCINWYVPVRRILKVFHLQA